MSAVDVRTKQFSWNPPFVKDFPVSSRRFTAGPSTGGRPAWKVYPGACTSWPQTTACKTPSTPADWPSSTPEGQTDRSARAETKVAGVPGKQPAHSSVIPTYVQVRDEIRMCQLRG